MTISVVIPTYNRAHTIERAIQSVLKQSKNASEIIVVDDGSKDKTKAILKSYKKDIKILAQSNQGVSAARNLGISFACSDWIALLDSDDEWNPDKLKNAEKFIKKNPDLKIFQSEEIWIRNGQRVNPKKKHKKHSGMIFVQSLPLCIVSPSAVVFKKDLWLEMGGFDESFPVCEDYDLWLRIARKYPFGLDGKPETIKYGGHDDQLSRSFAVMDKYRILAIEKQLNDPNLEKELRIAALSEILHKLKIVIDGAKKRNIDTGYFPEKLIKYKTELNKLLEDQDSHK